MLSDRELWERALAVESEHGDQVHLFITERISASVSSDDTAEAATWEQIAYRINQLGAFKGLG